MVLLGLTTYPDLADNEISSMLSLPNSTFASAKARIIEGGFLDEIYLPIFPKLGFELLATVYSDFNPSVTVEERVKNTSKAVEVYPELILSLGESHRGFSISIARNATRIMKISFERTKLLSEMDLIETKLPWEVMFPFQLSSVHRFFNHAPLLYNKFTHMEKNIDKMLDDVGFSEDVVYKMDNVLSSGVETPIISPYEVQLTNTQLEILYFIVRYPWMSSSKLSNHAPYSRHTISRTREKLLGDGYLAKMRIPDLSQLGYNILSLFHAQIDPKNPITEENYKRKELLQDDTMFMVSRPRELMMLAAYENYGQYNRGMSSFNQYLKINGHLRRIPNVRNHSLSEAIWIKHLEFHPLIRSTFDLNV